MLTKAGKIQTWNVYTYNKPNIKCFLKVERFDWAGHAEGSVIRKVVTVY